MSPVHHATSSSTASPPLLVPTSRRPHLTAELLLVHDALLVPASRCPLPVPRYSCSPPAQISASSPCPLENDRPCPLTPQTCASSPARPAPPCPTASPPSVISPSTRAHSAHVPVISSPPRQAPSTTSAPCLLTQPSSDHELLPRLYSDEPETHLLLLVSASLQLVLPPPLPHHPNQPPRSSPDHPQPRRRDPLHAPPRRHRLWPAQRRDPPDHLLPHWYTTSSDPMQQ